VDRNFAESSSSLPDRAMAALDFLKTKNRSHMKKTKLEKEATTRHD
jgi:hypothetical protein